MVRPGIGKEIIDERSVEASNPEDKRNNGDGVGIGRRFASGSSVEPSSLRNLLPNGNKHWGRNRNC